MTPPDVPLPEPFTDPDRTAKGEPRARVALTGLETLWLATGTLCNLTCANCYIESSPTNDNLAWLTRADAKRYLDEIALERLPVKLVGLTGGEPFMNPEIYQIVDDILATGLTVLVLTNAMTPMRHHRSNLLALKARHGDRLTLRVSVDHYTQARHEAERGPRSWLPMLDGLKWLSDNDFSFAVAGRTFTQEDEASLRRGYAKLFAETGIRLDADNPQSLVLFPEMDPKRPVPEISTGCWDILHKRPEDQMCATSRMVIRRKGAAGPSVVACTLLPYDPQFELGATLAEAARDVPLNHPHCARFCVLGGGSCA